MIANHPRSMIVVLWLATVTTSPAATAPFADNRSAWIYRARLPEMTAGRPEG